MKNKISPIDTLRSEAASLLSKLEKSHSDFSSNNVLSIASNYALKNLPSKEEPSIENYIGSIISHYKAMVSDVKIFLKSAIQNTLGSMQIEVARTQTQNIEKRISDIDSQIINLQTDKTRKPIEYSKKSYTLWSWILYFIAIGETIFIAQSFVNLFGDNYIFGLIVGLIVSLANIFLVKFFVVNEIRDNTSEKKIRIASIFIIGIFLIAVNIALAYLRYYLLAQSDTEHLISPTLSVVIFLAIQLLITGASAYISFNFTPTKADRKTFEELEIIDTQLKDLAKEKDALNTEKRLLLDRLEFDLRYREECIHIEFHMIQKIEEWAFYTISVFKEENVLRRSDSIYPDCFRTAITLGFTNDNMQSIHQPTQNNTYES